MGLRRCHPGGRTAGYSGRRLPALAVTNSAVFSIVLAERIVEGEMDDEPASRPLRPVTQTITASSRRTVVMPVRRFVSRP